jgi:hypothetical protein
VEGLFARESHARRSAPLSTCSRQLAPSPGFHENCCFPERALYAAFVLSRAPKSEIRPRERCLRRDDVCSSELHSDALGIHFALLMTSTHAIVGVVIISA